MGVASQAGEGGAEALQQPQVQLGAQRPQLQAQLHPGGGALKKGGGVKEKGAGLPQATPTPCRAHLVRGRRAEAEVKAWPGGGDAGLRLREVQHLRGRG